MGEKASAADPVQEPEPEAEDISIPDSAHKADSEELTEGDEQPTFGQILRAVINCTASVNTLKNRLGGPTEEVSRLRQDLQKKSERTTAAGSRISDLEDKPHICHCGEAKIKFNNHHTFKCLMKQAPLDLQYVPNTTESRLKKAAAHQSTFIY